MEKSFWKGPSKKRDLLELDGAFQVALVVKNPPASAGDIRDTINPWVGKIPCKRAWQSTPVFLPGESHGQRSLVGYSPGGHRESTGVDSTEGTYHI